MSDNTCIDCGKQITKRATRCVSCNRKRPFSKETIEKMRQAKFKNPTRYWKGKNRSQKTREKISKANKGNTAWNKGKPWSDEVKEKLRKAHKGRRHSPETEFKKGMTPWNKGKQITDNPAIHTKHERVRRNWGKPEKCEFCDSTRNLEWTNKDHKYNMVRHEWQVLCRKCHMYYDIENNGRPTFQEIRLLSMIHRLAKKM